MSAAIDAHTLATVVVALEGALGFEWRPLPGSAADVRAARQAAATVVAWGQELCRTAECANCGSERRAVCAECMWPLGDVVPDQPLCSICRGRHGPEREHACE